MLHALEPRMVFDGAAIATGAEVVGDPDDGAAPVSPVDARADGDGTEDDVAEAEAAAAKKSKASTCWLFFAINSSFNVIY